MPFFLFVLPYRSIGMMFLFPVVGTIASLVVNPARVYWSHPMFAPEGFLQSRSMVVDESAVAEYFVMYESGSLSVGSFVLQLSLVFGTLLGEVVPSNWILAPLLFSVVVPSNIAAAETTTSLSLSVLKPDVSSCFHPVVVVNNKLDV